MTSGLLTIANRGSMQLPWFTLSSGLLAAILFLLAGAAPETLVYDRHAITQGEWWRLLSGHWVHSDYSHAQWDILAYLLIATMLEQRGGSRIIAAIAMSTLLVDGWLWWGLPELIHYCGLSGIINTLLVPLLYQLWKDDPHPLVLLTIVGYAGKLVIEMLMGQALFTDTAWPSLPSVHVAGLVAGATLLLTGWYRSTT